MEEHCEELGIFVACCMWTQFAVWSVCNMLDSVVHGAKRMNKC